MNPENTDKMCGQVRMSLVCSSNSAHFNKKVSYSCDDADCPECYEEVIKSQAMAVTDALVKARLEIRKAGLDPGHPYHFWISPPPSLRHLPLNQLAPRANEFALHLGLIGGYRFDHPYRFQDKHRQMEQYRAGKLDREYSPHFHFIAFLPSGFPQEKSNDFYSRTGWTYGNEGNENRKHTRPRNIFETAKYELSHCAREPWHQHQNMKRFGILHSSKLKQIREKERELLRCPRCGAPVHRRDPDTGEDLGEAYRQPKVHFELRPGTMEWLLDRWPDLEIHPVHLDLVELCELQEVKS